MIMKAVFILACIGLIGCVGGLIGGYIKDNSNKMIINLILICMDIYVIVFSTAKIRENTPNEVKYKMVDNVVCVNVDSVFTKVKMGVDTTYNIHYVSNPFWAPSVEYNVKHLEIDSVFTKTDKCVDTTYAIKYIKK